MPNLDIQSNVSEPGSSKHVLHPADRLAIDIPVIDIAGYLQPSLDPDLTRSIASEIHDAARSPGFFQITGNGVSPDLRRRLLESMRSFFALPACTKASLHRNLSPAMRGYEGVGDQMLEAGVSDRKEGFLIGAEWDGEEDGGRAGFLQGRNQWPAEEECPGFRGVMEEYFDAMRGLSKALFRLVALSLDLDEKWFDGFVGIGGLEVFHRLTQAWHPVKPVKDAFVVNIGDMMVSDKDRYSVAFFNEGRLDQIIECIPTCLKPGEQPRYEPVRVEAHLKERYSSSY
ncbi:hypothetical protein SLS53_001915 [Cytospora paraplurivora]|uniref:Non-haem dioxygenase N-terminal domain-containing protein n=1 Tax=Cytospora paraplurivora TaxID=2898453 RepID=A0AAN9UFJ7_9PEZI